MCWSLWIARAIAPSPSATKSANPPRRTTMKIAIIRAYFGKSHSNQEAQARGQGRSERKAASRALLNLLRDKRLRRQKMIAIHLDLVIMNSRRELARGESMDSLEKGIY